MVAENINYASLAVKSDRQVCGVGSLIVLYWQCRRRIP